MTSWSDFVAAEPGLAAAVRERLESHLHLYLATLRSDGSPRISGIELGIRDGDLWLAGIPGSLKLKDLRRDPRFELHSGSDDSDPDDPAAWPGDAKITGRAVEVPPDDPAFARYAGGLREGVPTDFELFRVEIVAVTRLRMGEPADHLVVEHWRPGQPVRRTRRV